MFESNPDTKALACRLAQDHNVSERLLALVVWRMMVGLQPGVTADVGLRVFAALDDVTRRAFVDDVVVSYPSYALSSEVSAHVGR